MIFRYASKLTAIDHTKAGIFRHEDSPPLLGKTQFVPWHARTTIKELPHWLQT